MEVRERNGTWNWNEFQCRQIEGRRTNERKETEKKCDRRYQWSTDSLSQVISVYLCRCERRRAHTLRWDEDEHGEKIPRIIAFGLEKFRNCSLCTCHTIRYNGAHKSRKNCILFGCVIRMLRFGARERTRRTVWNWRWFFSTWQLCNAKM